MSLLDGANLKIVLKSCRASQLFPTVDEIPSRRVSRKVCLAEEIHSIGLQSPQMLGGKLEGFAPNLLVKVAPAYGQHRVEWGHHHLREAHKALLVLPLS